MIKLKKSTKMLNDGYSNFRNGMLFYEYKENRALSKKR